jgi:hypothetical protein
MPSYLLPKDSKRRTAIRQTKTDSPRLPSFGSTHKSELQFLAIVVNVAKSICQNTMANRKELLPLL